jgi:hypothetical protein
MRFDFLSTCTKITPPVIFIENEKVFWNAQEKNDGLERQACHAVAESEGGWGLSFFGGCPLKNQNFGDGFASHVPHKQ